MLALCPQRAAAAEATAREAGDLARAERLIEGEELDEARKILDRLIRKNRVLDQALLARSTLNFVEGRVGEGRRDLERALAVNPGLRQGWLNRAALDMSETRYESALEALLKARELDPAAPDNGLNLGAVLVLQGRLEEGAAWFEEYLRLHPRSAQALYLVSTNYAMAGHADPAVEHLARAIAVDERWRLRARTDPNFADLERHTPYRRLLETDTFKLPAGTLTAGQVFDLPYDVGRGPLLEAVMNAVQMSGRAVEPQVEVTHGWTLLWTDYRIKMTPTAEGGTRVELAAPGGNFTSAAWERESSDFFREITVQLVRLRRPSR